MTNRKLETRLYVEDALKIGATVELDADRAHFLKHVLRLDKGAAVALFNARDGEHLAHIESIGKSAVTLSIGAQRRAAPHTPAPDLWLLFAPIKHGRIDFLAAKATELGATLLWPVFTRRTVVGRVNLDRLRANAMEAAEQCNGLAVPTINEPDKLERVIGGWDKARPLYVCAEFGEAAPAAEAFKPGPAELGAAILTGPEGGFEPGELDALRKLPFVTPVSLGPLIMRADTAALAALAVFQSVAGSWKTPRGIQDH